MPLPVPVYRSALQWYREAVPQWKVNGTVTIAGPGVTTIRASQDGNGSYNPATTVEKTLTVNKLSQTITFNT